MINKKFQDQIGELIGTGIPQFTLSMWGYKNAESENRVNQGYLISLLKGRKIGKNYKPC